MPGSADNPVVLDPFRTIIEVGWNKITNEIGREHQVQVWRKGVESGIYLDKF